MSSEADDPTVPPSEADDPMVPPSEAVDPRETSVDSPPTEVVAPDPAGSAAQPASPEGDAAPVEPTPEVAATAEPRTPQDAPDPEGAAGGSTVGERSEEPAAAESELPEPADEPDPVFDPIVAQLRDLLSDGVVIGTKVSKGNLWVRVPASEWYRTVEACRDRLGFTYFCFLSGIDWKVNPNLGGEKLWDPDAEPTAAPAVENLGGSYGGGDSRFQVLLHLIDVTRNVGIHLKADLDDASPTVQSIVPLFRGADWHERETWEMYGFEFDGHPGLRHLYLPGAFEGFPLRKDFPLLSREVKPWPGLVNVEAIPGEDDAEEEVST